MNKHLPFIADTTALIVFFTTTGALNERFVAGMSWEQVLHARLSRRWYVAYRAFAPTCPALVQQLARRTNRGSITRVQGAQSSNRNSNSMADCAIKSVFWS
ncbi:L-alanine exporter AlaE [Pseudomonas sp. MLB6B]